MLILQMEKKVEKSVSGYIVLYADDECMKSIYLRSLYL